MIRIAALLLLLVAALPTRAAEPPTILLDLLDGTKLKGAWIDAKIRFQLEAGLLEIDADKVRSLTLNPAPEHPDAIVVGSQQLELPGKCLNQSFTVSVEGAERTLPRDSVRGFKVVRAGPTRVVQDIVIPLLTLCAMEIILGIDNIIFLAIVAGKLPKPQQPRARRIGLLAALGTRLLLLATLSFILGLTTKAFTIPDLPFLHDLEAREISWRDLILLVGGMFLIGKSTFEIHEKLEKPIEDEEGPKPGRAASFGMVLIQIAVIDIIFSLDSVITAVGMVDSLAVMVTAMLVAVGVMMVFAEGISKFVTRNPTLKVLALAFLILIGVLLVAEGFGQHIDKGYVYFAMAFSVIVETVNIRMRKKSEPVRLNQSELPAGIS